MNRRDVFKWMGLTALLGWIGAFISCSRGNLLTWAHTAVLYLEQTADYFAVLIPNSTAILQQAVSVAKALEAALKINSPDAVDLIEQLLAPGGLISQVIDQLGLITDEGKRKEVTALLMIAQVALLAIATALNYNVPSDVVGKAQALNKSGVGLIQKIAKSDKLTRALLSLKS